jgi:hypothetical protein
MGSRNCYSRSDQAQSPVRHAAASEVIYILVVILGGVRFSRSRSRHLGIGLSIWPRDDGMHENSDAHNMKLRCRRSR